MLFAGIAPAAVPPDLARQLHDDHEELTHYEWTATFVVTRAGKPLGSVVETMGFGGDGLPMRRMVKDDRTPEATKKHAWEKVEALTDLALPYVLPTLDMFGQFLDGATASNEDKRIELKSLGYIDPADEVTLAVDPETHHATSLSVTAPFETGLAKIDATYEAVAEGPNHPSRITVVFEGWQIVISNTSYARSH